MTGRLGMTEGATLKRTGRIEESLEWMKNACETSTDNATLYANVALLEFELNNYDLVQEYLDKAFAIDTNQPEALHTQSMLLSGLASIKKHTR